MSDIGNIRGGQPISPTDGVQRTERGGTSAAGGVSTTPPPVDDAVIASAAPAIAAPRVDAAAANERFLQIQDRLGVTGSGGEGEKEDFSSMMLRLQMLQQKENEQQVTTQGKQLEAQRLKIQQNTKDQLDAIQAEIDAQKKADTWGIFGKIFQVVAIVVSAIAAAATGGLAGPLLALAIVAVGTLQMVPGAAEKMFGKDAAPWVMLGLSVALAIAGGVAAWKSAATAMVKLASTAAQAGATVGQGLAATGSAVAGYDVAGTQRDLADVSARNLALKKGQDEIMDELKKILEQLESGVRIVGDILRSQDDSRMHQVQTLTKS